MVQSTVSVKRIASRLAECELFGTPEQYKEQAAQLRKQLGKVILKAILREAKTVVASSEANMARVRPLLAMREEMRVMVMFN